MKLQSAGVEIYACQDGIKKDSLFMIAEGFQIWKDSVAFRVKVPNRFMNDKITLVLSPIFYLRKTKNKGELPQHLIGKEQPVNNLILKIKSDPAGAKVFLIPKLYWELNPELAKFNAQALFPFLVSEGPTNVITYVQEYVYIVVYHYKKKFTAIQCSPNHLQAVNSVFYKLN